VAHTQRDSQGGSTRRGQRTFPSEYYDDGHSSYQQYIAVNLYAEIRWN